MPSYLELDHYLEKGPHSMTPRRVLVVTPSGRNIGGSEVMLTQFLGSAASARLLVHVVFLQDGDHFEEVKKVGYSCEFISAGRLRQPLQWLRVLWAVTRVLKAFKPDLIIGWQSKAVPYAGCPARLARVPFFCFHRGNPGGGFIDRSGYVLPCDGYLANSSFTANKLRSYTRRPISIIHSAVDCSRFDPDRVTESTVLKARFGFDPDRPLVGIVGRLQRWKGIHIFANAMLAVRKIHPDCQAVIVGGSHGLEPEYVKYLESQFPATDSSVHIRMVGPQKNVHEWMQAMYVIVHATEKEPFGIVVIEAMSLGKAVIASIPGGPAEVIEHETSGLLVRHGDQEELVGAIVRFLGNPDFAARCGQRARKSALKYDGANYASRVIQAVDGLLAG